MSLFWGHASIQLVRQSLVPVSALSGESILGPRDPVWPKRIGRRYVSALSGESILGPLNEPECHHARDRVSALSGESILGPLWLRMAADNGAHVFQHSLVSLFWGHTLPWSGGGIIIWVSALSGESILGPPDGDWRPRAAISCFSTLW